MSLNQFSSLNIFISCVYSSSKQKEIAVKNNRDQKRLMTQETCFGRTNLEIIFLTIEDMRIEVCTIWKLCISFK